MFILLAVILFLGASPVHAAEPTGPVFAKLGLSFERNEGQFDPKVRFLARSQGYSVYLTADEAVMRFMTPKSSAIRMKFLGQRRNVPVDGVDVLAGTTNYLLGNGVPQRANIRSYQKVRYSEIYPGVDVEYHGDGRLLEYDFVVKPGSDPNQIRIAYSGIHGVSLDASGDLLLKTDGESIVQKKPRAYQLIDGQEQTVDAGYAINGGRIGFKIGGYDKTKPLIIDPVLIYSTFFGGSASEIGYGIAVDSQGAVYVTGLTASTDFPSVSAAQSAFKAGSTDGFIFKLDPTATEIVYSTFFGGSATDEGHSIAVDAGGNAYVTGYTQSSDFPIVNGFQKTRSGEQEAYLLKLNSSGTAIAYSTFLGGSLDDRGLSIALDNGGNAYITGSTASTNFPTSSNAFQRNHAGGFADGFVTKIGAAGNLIYSTFMGGIGNDNPLGIAVDGNGAAYVTGWTTSVIFPLLNAFQTKFGGFDQPIGTDDVFVFKLNPAGTALEYSTYVGGTGSDEATRIAVDSTGNAYVTGYTNSLNFPTAKPYQVLLSGLSGFDAFVFKIAPDGKSLVFSTYFGGFDTDSGTGIAVDASGAVYVAGYTVSFDLPTANQIQGFIGGDRDAFIAKFDPSGTVLVFSTFLGGSGTDSATGLTVDAAGNAYVVGFTNAGDFKTEKPVQATHGGAQDIFVAKMNVQDIVSSSQFQVAPQGASSVVTKGTRTDAVFGYAVAEPVVSGTELTGLAIIDRRQNGSTVSEVGIPVPPLDVSGRLFVDVSATGQSVLSIANPNDEDATVDFFYTDETGATTKYATTTVKAHQHFSRFVSDQPLEIFAPGTVNFASSIPVAATSFITNTNEASELLIGITPIINPVTHTQEVGNKPVTIPELAEGGGWRSDVVLVNTGEDRMNGEVHFLSPGAGGQPGTPMEVGIGAENSPSSVVEYDIPGRGFQRISTSGGATIAENSFSLTRATSVSTPGAGAFQISGWASADSTDPASRLTGLELLEYRQLGVTQSQLGILAPSLRQSGRFFAEVTDKVRSFIAIANPTAEEVAVDIFLTDDSGTSTNPVTVTVPANGQYSQFLADQPLGFTANTQRTVNFTASQPVFVTALRLFTNERNESLLSAIPIGDTTTPIDQPNVVPQFADGAGWKTQVILVNTSEDEIRGELRFLGPGSSPVFVGTTDALAAAFEYHIQPRSFFRLQTNGLLENLSTGSVQVVPFLGYPAPAAHAVVSLSAFDEAATAAAGETRTNTIFETAVQAQLPAANLRFYVEANGDFNAAKPRSTRSAVAIANPSSQPVTVQLEVSSFNDVRLGLSAPITIPANGQFSGYLLQVPGLETLPVPFQGVMNLRVQSGSGVIATSFRTLINERSDYLLTTTGPLNEDAGLPGRLILPFMTDSTGYTAQFILINPAGVQSGAGILHYLSPDGSPLNIDSLKLGSIQVVPFAGSNTPHAHVLLSHRDSGVLTSIMGIEGQLPGKTFRIYVESIGDFEAGANGSVRSGVGLANPSETAAAVVLELRSLDGTLLRTSRPVQVPPNGQVALLLNQIPGFETLTAPFEGVLRVVATSAQGITATGLRTLYNERGNLLFTTTGPLVEHAGAPAQLIFPHIAEGGGYTTQFVVIGGVSGQANTGVLRFFNQEGNPLNLTLTTR